MRVSGGFNDSFTSEPVRVSQFAKRSRLRNVCSFVRSVSPVSVSGSGESHHGMHPLHGSQQSQSDSVLPETRLNCSFVRSVSLVSVSGCGESHNGMHPLHGSQPSQSDSVLLETRLNWFSRVSGESNGE